MNLWVVILGTEQEVEARGLCRAQPPWASLGRGGDPLVPGSHGAPCLPTNSLPSEQAENSMDAGAASTLHQQQAPEPALGRCRRWSQASASQGCPVSMSRACEDVTTQQAGGVQVANSWLWRKEIILMSPEQPQGFCKCGGRRRKSWSQIDAVWGKLKWPLMTWKM